MNQIVENRKLLEALYQQVRLHMDNAGEYRDIFNAINNKVVLCCKIFDSKDFVFSNNEEELEAIKIVLRDLLFIPTISVFEYNLLLMLPDIKAPKTCSEVVKKSSVRAVRYIKFNKLVSWLGEDKLLKEEKLWRFALKIRNDIVHFNSIALSSESSPNENVKIYVIENFPITGEITSFVNLVKILEEDLYQLVLKQNS